MVRISRAFWGACVVFCMAAGAGVHVAAAHADPGGDTAVAVDAPRTATAEGTVVQIISPGVSVRALIAAGKLDEALQRLDDQLFVNPSDDEVRLQRARILYWKGRNRAALEAAEEVLQRHPADVEVMELVAQIRLAQGKVSASLEMYQAMQALGDNRPEIRQRIIDLLLQLEDMPGLELALARGGALSDEQELALARLLYPWSVDAGGGLTLYNDQVWPRFDGGLGRRVNKSLTLVGGASVEQRARLAWSPRLEAYFGAGRVGAMLHVSGSPSEAFLPKIDLRGDLSVGLTDGVSLGLWLRYAVYAPADVTPVNSITIGPNVSVTVGRWTLTPGYLLMLLDPGGTAHTAMLKVRMQASARTAWFTWCYFGTDPNFVDRQSARPTLGFTGLLGVDHWFTGQFGLRASVSRIQPLGNYNAFTEFALGLRGRL